MTAEKYAEKHESDNDRADVTLFRIKKKMKRKCFLGVRPAHTALNGRPRSSHWSNLESMEYAGYTAATESNNTPT